MKKIMTMIFLSLSVSIACLSCSTFSNRYFHSFSFDTMTDGKKYGVSDVVILDYSYGDCEVRDVCMGSYYSEYGRPKAADSITGYYPRGESLYVKWGVLDTQKTYEDTVDLRHRMPRNITGYAIHFLVDGPQLYVFLIPPPHAGWIRDMWVNSALRERYQIYPDVEHGSKK